MNSPTDHPVSPSFPPSPAEDTAFNCCCVNRTQDSVPAWSESLQAVLDKPLGIVNLETERQVGFCGWSASVPSGHAEKLTVQKLVHLYREIEQPVFHEIFPDRGLFVLRHQDFLVVTETDRQNVDHLTAVTKLFFEQEQLKSTVTELRLENEDYLKQITADMEELTYLRQLSSLLELKQNHEGIEGPFFETVCSQVHCESVLFIPNTKIKDDLSRELRPVIHTNAGLPQHRQDSWQVPSFGNEVAKRVELGSGPAVQNGIDETDKLSLHSFISCPVEKSNRRFGWLVAVNRMQQIDNDRSFAPNLGRSEFGSIEAGLIASAAAMYATHLSNMDLLAANQKLITDIVRCLVTAIESKDPYTCGHSERVARYGRRIGEHLGLDQDELEKLYLSGLLHDLGKIGIPDSILLKPAKPTDEEYRIIQQHPEDGWKILQRVKQLEPILQGVLFHHERMDGQGYPDGLQGEKIPLHGRILAVADAFDAMTSDRPYRNGMPVEKAYAILEAGKGTQWDQDMVEAFMAVSADIEKIKDGYVREPAPLREPGTTRILSTADE